MSPRFSVICNTLNRAEALRQLLQSLRHQTYPSFEVVVVAGPCTDHTDEVMEEFAPHIKARWCPAANLSMSRNIGIAAAVGDLVAFIDDDAVPEHTWLDQLAAMYDADEVAAAGGVVHDHTGYTFQSRFILCDRLGRAELSDVRPCDDFSFPGSLRYPSVLGCNSSFRRDVLVKVGGFDEEFEYYLDETDVCVRLVDAGYVVRQSDNAAVHHKFLPSSVRDTQKVVLDNFPIVKNAIYFSFVNGLPLLGLGDIYRGAAEFRAKRAADLRYHREHDRITEQQLTDALAVIDAAWDPGVAAGRRGRVRMYDPAIEEQHSGPFLPYPTIHPDGRRLRVCLVTQTLPPAVPGGIGRYCLDLGRALGARGHDVRIITDGDDHDTVDFEQGVWVHRIRKHGREPVLGQELHVPPSVAANMAAVAAEVVRIQGEGQVDVVYAPIWDSEGLAVLSSSSALTITSLMTTMGISLRGRPAWSEDPEFMASLGTPLHDLERHLLGASHGLHAISEAIVGEIEDASDVQVDDSGLFTSHLGVVDAADTAPDRSRGDDRVTVLFVGRFERRKGIDLLLDAIPAVLEAHPNATFELIGRDDLPNEHGVPYRTAFEVTHRGADWLDRVRMRGELDDETVAAAYRDCDVFVAPSRFESFGLIFVEAMMSSMPVVAVRRGAAPEVLGDEGTAFLVEPDATELADAIGRLVADGELRRAMGARARRRYEERFTVDAMADRVERNLRSCTSIRPGDERISGGSDVALLPDHSPGLSLREPVTVGPLPPGRVTVVLAADPTKHVSHSLPATVEVALGDDIVTVELSVAVFHHVRLPPGDERVVTVRATRGGAALAALHVVPGTGRRT